MTDDPTPGELKRRQDDLRDEMRAGFQSIGQRLDKMPTSDLLLAHMATWDTQLRAIREDVDEARRGNVTLESKIEKTATDLRAEIKEVQRDSTAAKRWAVGAIISGSGVAIAGIGLARAFAG